MRIKIAFIFFSLIFLFWLLIPQGKQTVDVVLVDRNADTVQIVVKNPPYTTQGKLKWWLKNSKILLSTYSSDLKERKAMPSIYIYDFADGFKREENKDRLCFSEIPPPLNCIDKRIIMIVSELRDGDTKISLDNNVFIRKSSELDY